MHLIIGDFDNGMHASSRVFMLWPDVGKRFFCFVFLTKE